MGAKRSGNWARSKSKSAGSNSTRVRKRLEAASPCSSLTRMLPPWRKMNSAIEATTPLRSGQETRRIAEVCIANFGFYQRPCVLLRIPVAGSARSISADEFGAAFALPIPIARHADQHNGGTPECFGWPLDDGVERPGGTDQNVDRGQPRVSGAAIGAGNLGAFPAQDEEADDGERIREHHAKNDVGVKLVVAPAHDEH